MTSLLVLADDLTGAADTGVAFAAAGLDSVLLLEVAGDPHPHGQPVEPFDSPHADVICVDTDTRGSPPDAAAAALRRAYRPVPRLYKKVDSTLRGNVAVELAAASEVYGSDVVLLAPAFPATGRTTVGGRQYVHGTPLARSDLWQGLRAPDRVGDLFASSGLTPAYLGLTTVREGRARVAAEVRERAAAGAQVVIGDAETDADLSVLAEAGVSCRELRILWAGSGGLASHLIDPLGLGSVAVPAPLRLGAGTGSLLAIVGSAAARCQEQARALIAAGFQEIALPAGTLLEGTDGDLAALSARLSEALRAGNTAVVIAGGEVITDRDSAARVAGALGRVVGHTSHPGAGLLLTGGETARAVLTAAGVQQLRLLGEAEPGVVVSRADLLGALPVVTKAGAFGDGDSLVRAARLLRGQQ